MKTGDGEFDTSEIEKTATDLFLPVVESATVLAAHYAKACGRDVVLAEDMHYGMMFAARNVTGRHMGSLYPEIYDESDEDEDEGEDEDEDDESESSWETVDDDELVWSRYTGTEDEQALGMNTCADTWNEWVPANPAERALKNAVDKNSIFGRE
jgi:hypothetical protein